MPANDSEAAIFKLEVTNFKNILKPNGVRLCLQKLFNVSVRSVSLALK